MFSSLRRRSVVGVGVVVGVVMPVCSSMLPSGVFVGVVVGVVLECNVGVVVGVIVGAVADFPSLLCSTIGQCEEAANQAAMGTTSGVNNPSSS